ncbi:MAG: hypothetical protein KDH20_09135, partial [Rhodocyclaceae bacterium]|nr:hypothetical protein [Rhodocyclaceae bacterium]
KEGDDAGVGADMALAPDADTLGILSVQETALAREMSPMPPIPGSPTNDYADDPAAATLGQKFYFEADWAGPLQMDSRLGQEGEPGKVSCFSCHDDQTFGSADNVGIGSRFHPRHAPGSVNAAWYADAGFTWRGRFDVMWALPRAVFEAGAIFNSSRLRVAHVVFDQYRAEYDAVFGDHPLPDLADEARFPATGKPGDESWDGMAPADQEAVNRIVANVGKALEAYQRRLQRTESPFDRWVAGGEPLNEAAQRGFSLFVGSANCVLCHSGPFFTDLSYRNLGLAQTGPNVPEADGGRFDAVGAIAGDPFNGIGAYSDDPAAGQPFIDGVEAQTDALMGRFRVPTARNAAISAPYMHAGQLADLRALVEFYDEGGGPAPTGVIDPSLVPLGLSETEKNELIAFLMALTGDPVDPALTQNTANP